MLHAEYKKSKNQSPPPITDHRLPSNSLLITAVTAKTSLKVTMFKYLLITSALLGSSLLQCSAFAPANKPFAATRASSLQMAYDMVAEPEGGEEIQAIDTMVDSRMKHMGPNTEIKSDEGDVQTFWLTASADGKLIGEYLRQIEKDASKKANFPGFRKGQIPPYAKPQMTNFALQEGIVKTCEAAVAAYGLLSLKGSDGSVEVHEDMKDITKGYKTGTSVQFTATFAAIFDPAKAQSDDVEEEATVAEDAEEEATAAAEE